MCNSNWYFFLNNIQPWKLDISSVRMSIVWLWVYHLVTVYFWGQIKCVRQWLKPPCCFSSYQQIYHPRHIFFVSFFFFLRGVSFSSLHKSCFTVPAFSVPWYLGLTIIELLCLILSSGLVQVFFSLDCNVLTYTSPFLSIQYDIGLFPKTDRTYHMSKQVLPDHNKFSHLLDFILLQLINPINFI